MNCAPFETSTVRCGPKNAVDDLNAKIETLEKEKDKLIKELLLSQEENQKLYIDVQSKNKVIVAANEKCEQLQEKLSRQEQLITNLTREKNAAQSKIKQMMAYAVSNKKEESIDDLDEDEYEVQTILNHEVKKGVRRFEIRWKNFPPSYDSWEKESNLNCPQLLKDYLDANGLN